MQTVFAVYGETNRLKTKVDHPNGEDFLITKIAQLTWLFEGIPATHGSWDIHIVDDGCPDGSGAVRAPLEPPCNNMYTARHPAQSVLHLAPVQAHERSSVRVACVSAMPSPQPHPQPHAHQATE